MQIPRNYREQKLKHKICQEPGCGVEFFGFPARKFCEAHIDPKSRAKKVEEESDHSKNAYIKHSYTSEVLIEIGCRVCGTVFRVRLKPKQFIYPGVCEKHRHNNEES
jgi:hypothetical protein